MSNPFDLKKGNVFEISKGITSVYVGLGWNIQEDKAGPACDVDLSIFGCIDTPKGPKFYGGASHAVTYANKGLKKPDGTFATADGSIIHSGDNTTGLGDGDDEYAIIDFSKLPADITEISVFATIFEAVERKLTFSRVKNCILHIRDKDANKELCNYNLQNEFVNDISVQIGSFVKNDGIWTFGAVGAGTNRKDLGGILEHLLNHNA